MTNESRSIRDTQHLYKIMQIAKGARFALIGLILILLPSKKLSAGDALSAHEGAELAKSAERIDHLNNTKWREDIPGAYRTKFGLQVDKSCLGSIPIGDPNAHETIELKPEMFEQALETAFYKMIDPKDGCANRYPEIKKYADEWTSEMRRAVLFCENSSNTTRASNYRSSLNPSVPKQIKCKDYNCKSSGQGVISLNTFNVHSIFQFKNSTPAFLIHEGLHSTHADNRPDHNEIEKVETKDTDPCAPSKYDDQVVVITAMCEGKRENMPEADLYMRMSQCGIYRGCTDLFAKKTYLDDQFLKSTGLDQAAGAESLCLKIYDRGYCEHTRISQRKSLIQAMGLEKYSDAVKEKVRSYIPSAKNRITKTALSLFPTELNRLQNLKDTYCFKRFFQLDNATGDLILKADHEDKIDKSDLAAEEMKKIFDSYFKNRSYLFSLNINSLVSEQAIDAKNADQEKINCRTVLKDASKIFGEIGAFFYGDDVQNTLLPIANGTHAKIEYSPLSEHAEYLSKFLGKDLVQKISSQLEIAHPDSPQFNCEKAGLNPGKAFQTMKEGFSSLGTNQPKSCPDNL